MGRKERRLREKEERKKKAAELSDLASHTRQGKDLVPQLMTTGKTQFASWMNVRMPEMLWAILLASELDRVDALRFFRIFSEYVANLPNPKRPRDLYLSDLAELDTADLKGAIEIAYVGVPEAARALGPLLLFPDLPGRQVWESVLPAPTGDEPVQLVEAVSKVLNHQSQEATDCRWVRVAYAILSERLHFPASMAEIVDEIIYYPNKGEMKKVRPTIHSTELTLSTMREHGTGASSESPWAQHFWETGLTATPCLVGQQNHPDEEIGVEAIQREISSLTAEVSQAFITTQTTSAIDARHDGAFGLVLYALQIAAEITQPVIPNGALGRIGLRTIVEGFILLSYLAKLDDPEKWLAYRNYGSGQAKLAFLKLLNTESLPDFVDMDALEELANEDMWQEFVTIKIGNWDTGNLRKMSESAGEKAVYDAFYDWTSGYIHSQWAVVRDTTMTTCLNPLHRLHRVPKLHQHSQPSVLTDVRQLLRRMIDILKTLYPY